MEPSAFDHPTLECDIIMKGGITSGVVYPLAVVELAKTYRLRSIGGTSAGAIAAALAAAAEHGRADPNGGFPKLATVPDFLALHLTGLFQPSRATRPAFRILLGFLGPGGKIRKAVGAALRLVRFHWLAFLAGALLGLFFFWLLADFPSNGQLIEPRAMPLRVITALIWAFIAAKAAFLWRAYKGINANGFGMCSGMPSHEPPRAPALTPFLAGMIDEIAGKTGGPLTFGDLWGGGTPEEIAQKEADPSLRKINLEVMTTNLTHGWPIRLPTSSRQFFFDPAEMARYFTADVVVWMTGHPARSEDTADQELIDRIVKSTPYRPLPAPADLPVVLATRMSLSFPVLISAVPLYAVDWSLKRNQEAKAAGRAPELGRCWFSDGGIGSNFPVHFFDGLLPSRPTFGINLRPFHPDHPKDEHDEANNVRFPTRAGQEILPAWTAIDGVASFLFAILGTMQNWVDNTQMRLPGYRDRVVHVHLTPEEGGLNLVMPPERIEALTARGQVAGRKLQTIDWDGHRWTRFRTAVAQLQEKLGRLEAAYAGGFRAFLDAHDPTSGRYRRPKGWLAYALQSVDDLAKVVQGWRGDPKYRLDDEPPHPEPDLRITPRR